MLSQNAFRCKTRLVLGGVRCSGPLCQAGGGGDPLPREQISADRDRDIADPLLPEPVPVKEPAFAEPADRPAFIHLSIRGTYSLIPTPVRAQEPPLALAPLEESPEDEIPGGCVEELEIEEVRHFLSLPRSIWRARTLSRSTDSPPKIQLVNLRTGGEPV